MKQLENLLKELNFTGIFSDDYFLAGETNEFEFTYQLANDYWCLYNKQQLKIETDGYNLENALNALNKYL